METNLCRTEPFLFVSLIRSERFSYFIGFFFIIPASDSFETWPSFFPIFSETIAKLSFDALCKFDTKFIYGNLFIYLSSSDSD